MLTRTGPSNTGASTIGGSVPGKTFGTFSMQAIKSDLFPERVWPHFDIRRRVFQYFVAIKYIHITTSYLRSNIHL